MKENPRNILLRRPTLFPWLILLLLGIMVYYSIIGIIALSSNPEGMMAFLIIPYLIPVMVILAGADFALRKMLQRRWGLIWLIECTLLLAWCAWFAWEKYYVTFLITRHNTPVVVLVTDKQKGYDLDKGHDILKWRTEIKFPEDNILVVQEMLPVRSWRHFEGKDMDGGNYREIYPMSYMGKDSVFCAGSTYAIQFFVLTSAQYPRFRMEENQFDSIGKAVCRKILEKEYSALNQSE